MPSGVVEPFERGRWAYDRQQVGSRRPQASPKFSQRNRTQGRQQGSRRVGDARYSLQRDALVITRFFARSSRKDTPIGARHNVATRGDHSVAKLPRRSFKTQNLTPHRASRDPIGLTSLERTGPGTSSVYNKIRLPDHAIAEPHTSYSPAANHNLFHCRTGMKDRARLERGANESLSQFAIIYDLFISKI